jgi:hypothetical protein
VRRGIGNNQNGPTAVIPFLLAAHASQKNLQVKLEGLAKFSKSKLDQYLLAPQTDTQANQVKSDRESQTMRYT